MPLVKALVVAVAHLQSVELLRAVQIHLWAVLEVLVQLQVFLAQASLTRAVAVVLLVRLVVAGRVALVEQEAVALVLITTVLRMALRVLLTWVVAVVAVTTMVTHQVLAALA